MTEHFNHRSFAIGESGPIKMLCEKLPGTGLRELSLWLDSQIRYVPTFQGSVLGNLGGTGQSHNFPIARVFWSTFSVQCHVPDVHLKVSAAKTVATDRGIRIRPFCWVAQ